jgi:hypothetical protein
LFLTVLAFFFGRAVEQRALAMRARSLNQQMAGPTATVKPAPPTHRELRAADIIALPFAEFYEALRSAPGEAREKWRVDLERMPAGPRRNAAVSGFYKLLVQFDPVTAAKDAFGIDDKDLRELAWESVAGAAPGFALKDIATIFLNIPADESDYRKYLDGVISQWIPIDPPGVARFYEEHPDLFEHGANQNVIASWAAIDPRAAKDWLNTHDYGGDVMKEFVMGWYLNDRTAAIDFAVVHADQLASIAGLDSLLSALYLDSKEDAKKFIERLPNDELRHNAFRSFEFAVEFGTAEETGEPDRTPRAIADWMVQFPPKYWRGHLAEVFDHWNDGAQQELFAWIEQQPPAIRSAVAAEYKMPVGGKVVDVVSTLLQYGNLELRDQLFVALFQNSASNLDQMKKAIVGSTLPVSQKDFVLQFVAKAEIAVEEQMTRERDADEAPGSEDNRR